MDTLREKFAPYALSILRIVAGIMFLMHGTQKLFGFPGEKEQVSLISLMGLAGIIEFVGGSLIAVGLFTRVAAFIASGQMAVAFFKAHLPQGVLPILNGGELAVLYCFVFLYLFARGPGILSLDAVLWSKNSETKME